MDESQPQLKKQRLQVLSWFFLERFLEMLLVSPLTLHAIFRESTRLWIEEHFRTVEIIAIVLFIVWKAMLYMSTFTRAPGCILPKIIYVILLVLLHIIFGILFSANWSPYFVVLAAGTAGAIYILLALLSLNGKVNTQDGSSYFYAMAALVLVLIVSQLVYFCVFADSSYGWFMMDVGSGLLVALIFTFNHIYISERCANSKRLEEVLERDGNISFLESMSLTTLAFHQPFNKEDKQRRRALMQNAA